MPSKFVLILALVATTAAAGGLAIAMMKNEDSVAAPTAQPLITLGEPDVEILEAGDGPPLAFQDRLSALNELQRRSLIGAIKDGGYNLESPIGLAFASDGTTLPFDPDQGPPAPPEGTDPGSVEVFVFGSVPPELRG